MKKFLAILLLFIYTMSAFGLSVKHHYCMDRLANINVSLGAGGDCSCDVPSQSSGCCKDKVVILKTDIHSPYQEVQLEENVGYVPVPLYLQSITPPESECISAPFAVPFALSNYSPAIFLLNQSFRI